MADLRILIAAALNSSDLSQSDIHETPIDRIGALAFADALGGALWALKWAGEARGYARAMALLTRRSKRLAGDFQMRQKLCRAALLEWLDDLCHSCGGRRVMIATENAPVRSCAVCNGTGRRRHSDLWRARQLGMEPEVAKKWSPRIDAVHQKISDAEGQAWRDVAAQLGRRESRAPYRKLLDPTPAVDILAPAPVGATTRTPSLQGDPPMKSRRG